MKFSRDRRRYLRWLFEAKKRYGLSILNYIITSNHIHLLVADTGNGVIPKSMQLVAGRTGQEYNQRKSRNGAFWEDRYHATIVQTNRHLMNCMVYIDLNMVRAGAVLHPSEWKECGCQEILNKPKRYTIIDRKALKSILGFADEGAMIDAYQQALSDVMHNEPQNRQPMWTESVAVGDVDYVTEVKRRLSSAAQGRKIIPGSGAYELHEPVFPYSTHFDTKNDVLRIENTFRWDIVYDMSDT